MIIQIQPWIDELELSELKKVVDSTFVTEHDLTEEFEAMTRELTGSKHALAVCNGTMALFCCLKALNIGPGDEVIVPNMTFIATANAVILAGAKPIFCEIREDTFCIDTGRAEELVNENTRAIIPVHLYGQSADMDEVISFARKHDLKVIEDAAQGVGVRFNGRHTGTFGEMGILSYYGNKTITTGEGGMILTDDDALARICYRLKNHGRDAKGIFIHEHIGFNFSFTEMQAAVGIAQMKKLSAIIQKKKEIYQRYMDELSGLERFRPVHIDERCEPVFWFTSFLSDDTDELAKFLLENGIQTRRFFYPLHLQPCYKEIDGLAASSYLLQESEQDLVIEKIKEFYRV